MHDADPSVVEVEVDVDVDVEVDVDVDAVVVVGLAVVVVGLRFGRASAFAASRVRSNRLRVQDLHRSASQRGDPTQCRTRSASRSASTTPAACPRTHFRRYQPATRPPKRASAQGRSRAAVETSKSTSIIHPARRNPDLGPSADRAAAGGLEDTRPRSGRKPARPRTPDRGYDPLVPTNDALAIDGGTPVRSAPLDFSKGSALVGAEEAEALSVVIAGRSLFRYKGDLTGGTVAAFERAAAALLDSRFAVAVANGTAGCGARSRRWASDAATR